MSGRVYTAELDWRYSHRVLSYYAGLLDRRLAGERELERRKKEEVGGAKDIKCLLPMVLAPPTNLGISCPNPSIHSFIHSYVYMLLYLYLGASSSSSVLGFDPSLAAASCSSAITSAGIRSGVVFTSMIMGRRAAPSRPNVTQLDMSLSQP